MARKEIRQSAWLPSLSFVVAVTVLPGTVSADVVIDDLTENPVTAVVSDSLNPGDNRTITADKDTPEKVSFSISVDGIGSGSGIALMLGKPGGLISDILELSATQHTRGMGIKYVSIGGTFTSDTDSNPQGLTEFFQGLGLPEDIAKKIMSSAVVENGTQQDLTAALIDTTTGKALSLPTTIKAASDVVPEPSSFLPVGLILLVLAFLGRRAGPRTTGSALPR